MAKICTTIEQSRKLLELVIDINTADMSYQHFIPDVYIPQLYEQDEEDDIPAWSLAALLKLISNWQMQTQDNGIGILYGCKEEIKIIEGETPLDAAFQMVVWLKENGKI